MIGGATNMADPTHDPIAYVYEADVHCLNCGEDSFGIGEFGFAEGTDREGNEVGVIPPWGEWWEPTETGVQTLTCGTCQKLIASIMTGPLGLRRLPMLLHYWRCKCGVEGGPFWTRAAAVTECQEHQRTAHNNALHALGNTIVYQERS